MIVECDAEIKRITILDEMGLIRRWKDLTFYGCQHSIPRVGPVSQLFSVSPFIKLIIWVHVNLKTD